MNISLSIEAAPRMILDAVTAADLMATNPLSLEAEATVHEASVFLTDHGFSAAPVIDKAGRPVGVVSQTDLIVHDRENVDYLPRNSDYYACEDNSRRADQGVPAGFEIVNVDTTTVRDIMTPMVFSVSPEMSAHKVVEEMLNLKVHRLFVVDRQGVMIGVVSTVDVLRHLRTEQ